MFFKTLVLSVTLFLTPGAFCDRLCENFSYFDNSTQQCHRAGGRGPCEGVYMRWWGESRDSSYGFCSCYSSNTRCSSQLSWPIARSIKDNQCYPLYEKAHCQEGEWFTTDENFRGICTKNPCLKEPDPTVNSTVFEKVREDLTGILRRYGKDGKVIDGKEEESSGGEEGIKIQKRIEEIWGLHPWDIDAPRWFLQDGKCYKTFSESGFCGDDMIPIYYGTFRLPQCVFYKKTYLYSNYVCPKIAPPPSAELICPEGFIRVGEDCIPPLGDGSIIDENH